MSDPGASILQLDSDDFEEGESDEGELLASPMGSLSSGGIDPGNCTPGNMLLSHGLTLFVLGGVTGCPLLGQ